MACWTATAERTSSCCLQPVVSAQQPYSARMLHLQDDARRRLLQTGLWVVAPCVLVLALGVVFTEAVDRPFALLVRDVTVAADLPYYSGALAGLTVMVWTAGAAVPLAAVLPRWRSRAPLVRVTLVLAVLTLALACDDQFQVHEAVGPRFGVPEKAVLLVYAVTAVTTAVVFRHELAQRPEGAVLGLAGLLLAGSVGIDVVAEYVLLAETPRILLEDGLKLVGAAVWSAALIGLAAAVQRESPRAG